MRSSTSSRTSTSRKTSKSSKSASTTSKTENTALFEVFTKELKDVFWAEKYLLKAMPKMIKAATSGDLVETLEEHLEVTKGQVERLEEVFSILEMKAIGKKCHAMEGLVQEGEEAIGEMEQGPGLDAAIIMAAQKIEHYEIASYGCLRTFANVLGLTDAAELFQQTLDEESEADEKLTAIAESTVNIEAVEDEE